MNDQSAPEGHVVPDVQVFGEIRARAELTHSKLRNKFSFKKANRNHDVSHESVNTNNHSFQQ